MKHRYSAYDLAVCGLMAAVMCVLGPLSIPIGAVPVSFTNFVVCLAVCLLGWKWGTVSVAVYLLLGLVGLPVFSGYAGGLGKLAGPTGGYLIGFLFLALIGGFFVQRFRGSYLWTVIGLVLGMAVTYGFGTAWFVYQMECSLWYALTVCVFPFAAVDVVKIVAAALAGGAVRRQLIKARLMKTDAEQSK